METTHPQHNVIHTLAPALANKIAAGEVVDRPASVVKELLDNAIDSGADDIRIVVQDAGRTLIQMVDNGCGMSKADLPLSIQRHATSKINSLEDLYNIHTLGFRGEAMASIASVAQLTLKTRRHEDETGWEYEVWGGEEKSLKPTPAEAGTSVSVRNLFFNVPARRAFLKTDATELRHIIITVQQAALAHPEIAFELRDGKESIYRLPQSSLANRIAGIFGEAYKQHLIPVEEATSLVSIHGYLIDPKMAKKNRGEQFLFVNKRPFLHRHLNYIIQSVYSNWIGKEQYPFYVLFFKVDTNKVDVNVHPTKLEVKFDDERSISVFTKSIVKRVLNERFNVPMMSPDERDRDLSAPNSTEGSGIDPRSSESASRGRSAFSSGSFNLQGDPGRSGGSFRSRPGSDGLDMVEKLYPSGGHARHQPAAPANSGEEQEEGGAAATPPSRHGYDKGRGFWQLHDQYIISQTRSGMFIVDQYFAHTRILFEKALNSTESDLPSTQQLLFPQHLKFSAADFALLEQAYSTLKKIGFNIQLQSAQTAVLSGVPADLSSMGEEKPIIEMILQEYQTFGEEVPLNHRQRLVMAFAAKAAIPRGKKLSHQEMEALIDQLFACDNPFFDPINRPTTVFIPLEDIHKRFR